MKNSLWLWILLIVIILIAGGFLIAYFMKRKNQNEQNILVERKIALFDLPVMEEVDSIKKMHLVGQSQNTFREWNQKWIDLSTISFAELESLIFEIENLNETFKFFKVKEVIVEATEKLEQMEKEVELIRVGLNDLAESEERNSQAVQKALDAYEQIREKVNANADDFGISLKELEKQIAHLEREFTNFVALNTAGDPMEARLVLEKSEERTYELQGIIEAIPPLFDVLDNTFPKQLKEIRDGYKALKNEHYVFDNDSIEADVEKLETKIHSTLMNLEKLEIDNVGKLNEEIARGIDQLYAVMEKEINARQFVFENKSRLTTYLSHTEKNNHVLMIELDHISQSYVLSNNEIGKIRGFEAQIEEINREIASIDEKLEEKQAVFSQVAVFFKDSIDLLKDMEAEQLKIDETIKNFAPRERAAVQKIDEYELELRTIKRYVEKQRLPGIPSTYLEFFYVAGERIEELSRELNKIRIDMNLIDRTVALCEEDLSVLREKTESLVDNASLTEQMIQYANRFRFSHPEIKNAIEKSMSLFSREYRYQESYDIISESIESIEPGAPERIRKYYIDNKKAEL